MYIKENFNTVLKTHLSKNITTFDTLPVGTRFSFLDYITDPDYKGMEETSFIKTEPFNPVYEKPPLIKMNSFNSLTISPSNPAGLFSHFENSDKIIVREDIQ